MDKSNKNKNYAESFKWYNSNLYPNEAKILNNEDYITYINDKNTNNKINAYTDTYENQAHTQSVLINKILSNVNANDSNKNVSKMYTYDSPSHDNVNCSSAYKSEINDISDPIDVELFIQEYNKTLERNSMYKPVNATPISSQTKLNNPTSLKIQRLDKNLSSINDKEMFIPIKNEKIVSDKPESPLKTYAFSNIESNDDAITDDTSMYRYQEEEAETWDDIDETEVEEEIEHIEEIEEVEEVEEIEEIPIVHIENRSVSPVPSHLISDKTSSKIRENLSKVYQDLEKSKKQTDVQTGKTDIKNKDSDEILYNFKKVNPSMLSSNNSEPKYRHSLPDSKQKIMPNDLKSRDEINKIEVPVKPKKDMQNRIEPDLKSIKSSHKSPERFQLNKIEVPVKPSKKDMQNRIEPDLKSIKSSHKTPEPSIKSKKADLNEDLHILKKETESKSEKNTLKSRELDIRPLNVDQNSTKNANKSPAKEILKEDIKIASTSNTSTKNNEPSIKSLEIKEKSITPSIKSSKINKNPIDTTTINKNDDTLSRKTLINDKTPERNHENRKSNISLKSANNDKIQSEKGTSSPLYDNIKVNQNKKSSSIKKINDSTEEKNSIYDSKKSSQPLAENISIKKANPSLLTDYDKPKSSKDSLDKEESTYSINDDYIYNFKKLGSCPFKINSSKKEPVKQTSDISRKNSLINNKKPIGKFHPEPSNFTNKFKTDEEISNFSTVVPFRTLSELKNLNKKNSSLSDSFDSSESISSGEESCEFLAETPMANTKVTPNVNSTNSTRVSLRSSFAESFSSKADAHIYESIDPVIPEIRIDERAIDVPEVETEPIYKNLERRISSDSSKQGFIQSTKDLLKRKTPDIIKDTPETVLPSKPPRANSFRRASKGSNELNTVFESDELKATLNNKYRSEPSIHDPKKTETSAVDSIEKIKPVPTETKLKFNKLAPIISAEETVKIFPNHGQVLDLPITNVVEYEFFKKLINDTNKNTLIDSNTEIENLPSKSNVLKDNSDKSISASASSLVSKKNPKENQSYSFLANDLLAEHKNKRQAMSNLSINKTPDQNEPEKILNPTKTCLIKENLNGSSNNITKEPIYFQESEELKIDEIIDSSPEIKPKMYEIIRNGDDSYKYYGEELPEIEEIVQKNDISKSNSAYSQLSKQESLKLGMSKMDESIFETSSLINRSMLQSTNSIDPVPNYTIQSELDCDLKPIKFNNNTSDEEVIPELEKLNKFLDEQSKPLIERNDSIADDTSRRIDCMSPNLSTSETVASNVSRNDSLLLNKILFSSNEKPKHNHHDDMFYSEPPKVPLESSTNVKNDTQKSLDDANAYINSIKEQRNKLIALNKIDSSENRKNSISSISNNEDVNVRPVSDDVMALHYKFKNKGSSNPLKYNEDEFKIEKVPEDEQQSNSRYKRSQNLDDFEKYETDSQSSLRRANKSSQNSNSKDKNIKPRLKNIFKSNK